MSRYYVNKNAQENGDHEVHTTGCSFMPTIRTGSTSEIFLRVALPFEKRGITILRSTGANIALRPAIQGKAKGGRELAAGILPREKSV
jgi:hypothetical protein